MVLAFLLLHFHSLHTAFSITCALPTQRNGLVMLCDIPAHPLALPRSLSTHALCCSSQSAFLLASSFLLVALFQIFRTWFPIFAQPPLPADLRQLLTDLPPQNLAAASNCIFFPHKTCQYFHRQTEKKPICTQHCSPVYFFWCIPHPFSHVHKSTSLIIRCGSSNSPFVTSYLSFYNSAFSDTTSSILLLNYFREQSTLKCVRFLRFSLSSSIQTSLSECVYLSVFQSTVPFS